MTTNGIRRYQIPFPGSEKPYQDEPFRYLFNNQQSSRFGKRVVPARSLLRPVWTVKTTLSRFGTYGANSTPEGKKI
jgi:hypothetical protein